MFPVSPVARASQQSARQRPGSPALPPRRFRRSRRCPVQPRLLPARPQPALPGFLSGWVARPPPQTRRDARTASCGALGTLRGLREKALQGRRRHPTSSLVLQEDFASRPARPTRGPAGPGASSSLQRNRVFRSPSPYAGRRWPTWDMTFLKLRASCVPS